MSDSPADRRDALVRIVQEQGYCSTSELSAHFDVSEMTIRRDVAKLVAEQRLRSFHGGVSVFSQQDLAGSEYWQRASAERLAKQQLARSALEYVDEGSTIAFDAGTTITELAGLVAAEPLRISAVTASLPVANVFANGAAAVDLTVLGGTFHSSSQSFSGSATLAAISDLHADTLFLGASALNERGAYCANDFDALTKRALIDIADRVVLLADSNKFSRSAIAKVCDWERIDLCLIDEPADAETRRLLDEIGVPLQTTGIPALEGAAR